MQPSALPLSLHISNLLILSLLPLSIFLLAALSFYSHHGFPEPGIEATPPSTAK